MRTHHPRRFSRRRFLGGLTVAGMGGFLGLTPRRVAAEPPVGALDQRDATVAFRQRAGAGGEGVDPLPLPVAEGRRHETLTRGSSRA